MVRASFSLLPLARNLVWLTAGPFGAPFQRGRSSRFGQIWKRGPDCQGALRWRCQRMVRGNSSPINGENQRFWKHLSIIICRGEGHAAHLARPPSLIHVKNRSKWHHLQKIFSARGSSSSFSPFTLKCPNSSFLETSFEFFCRGTVSSTVFSGYYPHTGSSPFLCPSLSTWRKSAILETPEGNFMCQGETHAAHSARHPSPLHGKNRAN